MKVAIYIRVSDKKRQDLANQEPDLIEFVKRKAWSYDIFREKESTRKTRPIKQQLIQLCREMKYDVVLVWRLDRFGRSVRELVTEIDELESRGIKFISLKEGIDLTTPNGRLQFHIISAFAEFERAIISERTKAGLERAKRRGKKLGRPKGSKDKKKRKRRSS